MDRETEAMQGLIDGLLDVEAIENGSRRFGQNAVNFRASIEQVIERFQPHAQRKDIKIEWSAPVGVLQVKGDVVTVRQVVENLVSNAVKYSPIGGRVTIRLVENEDEIRSKFATTVLVLHLMSFICCSPSSAASVPAPPMVRVHMGWAFIS